LIVTTKNRFRAVLLFIGCEVLYACAMNHGPQSLRILSCNIQAGSSTRAYREYVTRSWSHVLPNGKRANLNALADLFKQYDFVGVQEADPGSLRSGFDNQGKLLAEAAKFPFVTNQANRRISRIAGSGNALMSHAEPHKVFDYALPGRIAGRGLLLAQYGEGDDAWYLGVTHLSLGAQSRAYQIEFLCDVLGDKKRLVLMGDFNCGPDTPEMQKLYQRTALTPPHARRPTFPSWAPTRSLDHIFVAGFHTQRYEVIPAAGSDHMAVAVELV
jgi:endonuclease/exonuclease/phosphatase family metal-dependent hydrolase